MILIDEVIIIFSFAGYWPEMMIFAQKVTIRIIIVIIKSIFLYSFVNNTFLIRILRIVHPIYF